MGQACQTACSTTETTDPAAKREMRSEMKIAQDGPGRPIKKPARKKSNRLQKRLHTTGDEDSERSEGEGSSVDPNVSDRGGAQAYNRPKRSKKRPDINVIVPSESSDYEEYKKVVTPGFHN